MGHYFVFCEYYCLKKRADREGSWRKVLLLADRSVLTSNVCEVKVAKLNTETRSSFPVAKINEYLNLLTDYGPTIAIVLRMAVVISERTSSL